MSVAVWIGLIALAGLDAETGVVMLLYLDQAYDKFRAAGRMNSLSDLHEAVKEGAVQRIRPKMMAVCAILFGLLPIMWSPDYHAGADVMKRIATPMIGGVITSAILNLLIYPVIYVIWRKRALPIQGIIAGPEPVGAAPRKRGFYLKRLIIGLAAAALIGGAFYGGIYLWQRGSSQLQSTAAPQGSPLATTAVNETTVKLYGDLHNGASELQVQFLDKDNNPLDAGQVRLELNMDMPGMQMNAGGTVTPSGSPGLYRVKINPSMAGDWNAKVSWQGPKGQGQAIIPVTVKP